MYIWGRGQGEIIMTSQGNIYDNMFKYGHSSANLTLIHNITVHRKWIIKPEIAIQCWKCKAFCSNLTKFSTVNTLVLFNFCYNMVSKTYIHTYKKRKNFIVFLDRVHDPSSQGFLKNAPPDHHTYIHTCTSATSFQLS